MRTVQRYPAPMFACDQQSWSFVDYYMKMNLAQILQDYGYAAVFVGTFLEGETIMVLGGLAAQLGYLSLDWVIACGFCKAGTPSSRTSSSGPRSSFRFPASAGLP